jgi:hypothetical protein
VGKGVRASIPPSSLNEVPGSMGSRSWRVCTYFYVFLRLRLPGLKGITIEGTKESSLRGFLFTLVRLTQTRNLSPLLAARHGLVEV